MVLVPKRPTLKLKSVELMINRQAYQFATNMILHILQVINKYKAMYLLQCIKEGVYIYTYICIYVYVYVFFYVHVYVYVYVYAYVYAHVYVRVHVYA